VNALEIHGILHVIHMNMNTTNEMQLYRFIYYFW